MQTQNTATTDIALNIVRMAQRALFAFRRGDRNDTQLMRIFIREAFHWHVDMIQSTGIANQSSYLMRQHSLLFPHRSLRRHILRPQADERILARAYVA